MLKNIDAAPIEECFAYLLNLTQAYALIFAIQAIQFFADKQYTEPPEIAAPTEAKLVLYLLLCIFCYITSQAKTVMWCTATCILSVLITIASIIILVVALMQKNYFALVGIISIVISSTTVYLLYKVRGKLASNGLLSNAYMNGDTSNNKL